MPRGEFSGSSCGWLREHYPLIEVHRAAGAIAESREETWFAVDAFNENGVTRGRAVIARRTQA